MFLMVSVDVWVSFFVSLEVNRPAVGLPTFIPLELSLPPANAGVDNGASTAAKMAHAAMPPGIDIRIVVLLDHEPRARRRYRA